MSLDPDHLTHTVFVWLGSAQRLHDRGDDTLAGAIWAAMDRRRLERAGAGQPDRRRAGTSARGPRGVDPRFSCQRGILPISLAPSPVEKESESWCL